MQKHKYFSELIKIYYNKCHVTSQHIGNIFNCCFVETEAK